MPATKNRLTIRLGRHRFERVEQLVADGLYLNHACLYRAAIRHVWYETESEEGVIIVKDRGGRDERATMRLPDPLEERLERLVKDEHYPNRSGVIRDGIDRLWAREFEGARPARDQPGEVFD